MKYLTTFLVFQTAAGALSGDLAGTVKAGECLHGRGHRVVGSGRGDD